jgi:hypothetical protein
MPWKCEYELVGVSWGSGEGGLRAATRFGENRGSDHPGVVHRKPVVGRATDCAVGGYVSSSP